jgi:hypothetical protein
MSGGWLKDTVPLIGDTFILENSGSECLSSSISFTSVEFGEVDRLRLCPGLSELTTLPSELRADERCFSIGDS